jgi:chloramphenicol-sensitive protein RarD
VTATPTAAVPTSPPRAGVLASVGASTLFGTIFLLPPWLEPLDPLQIFGYRVIGMALLLTVLMRSTRLWSEVTALARRCRERPRLAAVVALDGALLGVQVWVFGWAPQTGHGLDISLGYLILPLVMVLVGVVVFGERPSRLQVLAVAIAAVGVAAAVALAGGLHWPTLLVALGLPPYFVCRRAFGVDTAGAQLLEVLAMLPLAAAFACVVTPSWGLVAADPSLVLGLVVLAILSVGGFGLYLTASRLLPFALFGVLGYVEPVLLVLLSLTVLGEPWHRSDTVIYVPIVLALAVLALDTARATRRSGPADARALAADGPALVS